MGVRPGAVSEIHIRAAPDQGVRNRADHRVSRLNSVPIMGRVGAGAAVEPEYEQVPPEGLGESRAALSYFGGNHRLRSVPAIPCCRNTRLAMSLWSIASSVIRWRASMARGRGQAEDRRALSESHRAGKVVYTGQPHKLQRQADQRGEAGMDQERSAHYPAEGARSGERLRTEPPAARKAAKAHAGRTQERNESRRVRDCHRG